MSLVVFHFSSLKLFSTLLETASESSPQTRKIFNVVGCGWCVCVCVRVRMRLCMVTTGTNWNNQSVLLAEKNI